MGKIEDKAQNTILQTSGSDITTEKEFPPTDSVHNEHVENKENSDTQMIYTSMSKNTELETVSSRNIRTTRQQSTTSDITFTAQRVLPKGSNFYFII